MCPFHSTPRSLLSHDGDGGRCCGAEHVRSCDCPHRGTAQEDRSAPRRRWDGRRARSACRDHEVGQCRHRREDEGVEGVPAYQEAGNAADARRTDPQHLRPLQRLRSVAAVRVPAGGARKCRGLPAEVHRRAGTRDRAHMQDAAQRPRRAYVEARRSGAGGRVRCEGRDRGRARTRRLHEGTQGRGRQLREGDQGGHGDGLSHTLTPVAADSGNGVRARRSGQGSLTTCLSHPPRLLQKKIFFYVLTI